MRVEISSIKDLPELHRMGHTCSNINGDLLFVWGGSDESVSAHVSARNNHLWIYETLTGYWRHRACSGECPPYLSGSTSALIGQRMFVFGGHSTAQDNWLNCLYCLDLDTFNWTDLGARAQAEPTKPIRSDKCVSWSYSGRLYVFGGYGWSQTEHLLQILDRQKDLQLTPDYRWPKFGWNNQLVEYDPRTNNWRWPSYSGRCPSARAAHSGALMGSTYYLFGGRDSRERLNDLYTLDMATFEWNQIAIFSDDPAHQTPERPFRHLLEQNEETGEVMEEDGMRGELDGDPREPVLSNHGDGSQEEEEEEDEEELMGDFPVLINEIPAGEEEEELTPSPSSSAHLTHHFHEALSTASGSDDDDEPDYPFDYPHPSHLLERWSLSSHQSASSNFYNANCSQDSTQLLNDRPTSSYTHEDPMNQSNSNTSAQDPDRMEEDAQLQEQEQQQQEGAPEDVAAMEQQQQPIVQEPRMVQMPAGRSFSSFTPISGEDIMLYGGISSQEENLSDCWLFNIKFNRWTRVDLNINHPRLWHTGSRTKANEVILVGGSCSDKVDEFCTDVLTISLDPKSLKKLALDTVARSVRMRSIHKVKSLPSTICKLIKLRKQALAITTMRRYHRPTATIVAPQ